MTHKRREVLFLIVLSGSLLAAGCESGFRVGDTWLVRPSGPITADRVHISRVQLGPQGERVDQRELEIELYSGHTFLKGPDGRVHPYQLEPHVTDELRNAIADRSWQVDRRPRPDVSDLVQYEVRVYDGDHEIPAFAQWTTPSLRPLPPAAALLIRTFQRADRMAYPLSGDIDLLQ